MNKVIIYALKSLGINFAAGVILFLPLMVMNSTAAINWLLVLAVIGVLSLVIQLIIGIVYAAGEKHELGKGMMLAVGIIFLIGFSVCGSMWM
jgi:uncharacterized membrane protein